MRTPFFHILANICYYPFLKKVITVILMDVKLLLIVILICIFLMMLSIFYVSFWHLCMPSLVMYLFKSFVLFEVFYVVGLSYFRVIRVCMTRNTSSMLHMCSASIFFPLAGLPFHVCNTVF